MTESSIKNQLSLTYYKLIKNLHEKYGKTDVNYFMDAQFKSVNKNVQRLKEGLIVHHIYEYAYPNLNIKTYAKNYPYHLQEGRKLVYANILEYLLLQIKILEKGTKKIRNLTITELTRICFAVRVINDYFMGYQFKKRYFSKMFGNFEISYSDYIDVLTHFIKRLDDKEVYITLFSSLTSSDRYQDLYNVLSKNIESTNHKAKNTYRLFNKEVSFTFDVNNPPRFINLMMIMNDDTFYQTFYRFIHGTFCPTSYDYENEYTINDQQTFDKVITYYKTLFKYGYHEIIHTISLIIEFSMDKGIKYQKEIDWMLSIPPSDSYNIFECLASIIVSKLFDEEFTKPITDYYKRHINLGNREALKALDLFYFYHDSLNENTDEFALMN